jgi:uncharacterized SAM-binding protein YcdF (DUF218 family)
LWWFKGESFLSVTAKLPAKGLVVEGWIGVEGIRAARVEYEHGGYEFIVATGGLTGERWMEARWSYAEMARKQLISDGVAPERIISAPATDTDSQRTWSSAIAVRRALGARRIAPEALNVFTLAAHARRSRMVFEKVLRPGTQVGVVSWTPPGYQKDPWWHSSERAEDLLKETAGFLYESLFNSGRTASSFKSPE